MANLTELTAEQASQIADSFAQASARVLDFRVEHRKALSDEEFDKLEKCEDLLDHMVVLFRKITIQLIGEKAADAVAEMKEAIEQAKATIGKTKQVKHVIKLAGNLVDLAVALASKNPKSILGAAKSLKEAAQADPGTVA